MQLVTKHLHLDKDKPSSTVKQQNHTILDQVCRLLLINFQTHSHIPFYLWLSLPSFLFPVHSHMLRNEIVDVINFFPQVNILRKELERLSSSRSVTIVTGTTSGKS